MVPLPHATEGIARLTDREKDCLRLVAQGYQTKDVALRLGISPNRAAKNIDGAMKKLGVSRRIEAARLLAEAEQRGVYVIPGASLPLHEDPGTPLSISSSEDAAAQSILREERLVYEVSSGPPDIGSPVRRRGERANDLNLWQRVIWIVLLGAVCLLGLGGLAHGIASLSNANVLS